ncbi:hypothetical protein DL93DRAFT_2226366 [Clavulina sp. PMI_390]|nr:hypothetical protein DL93DRAFT_2226366 [Clavulina sp. PMI_390]
MSPSTRHSLLSRTYPRRNLHELDENEEMGESSLDARLSNESEQTFSSLLVHTSRMGMPSSAPPATNRLSQSSRAQTDRAGSSLHRSLFPHPKSLEAGIPLPSPTSQARYSTGRSTKLPSYKEEESRPPSLTSPLSAGRSFLPELPPLQPLDVRPARVANVTPAFALSRIENEVLGDPPEEAVPEEQIIAVRSAPNISISLPSVSPIVPPPTTTSSSRVSLRQSHPFAINSPITIPSNTRPSRLFPSPISASPSDTRFATPRPTSKTIHEVIYPGNTFLESFGDRSFPEDNVEAGNVLL